MRNFLRKLIYRGYRIGFRGVEFEALKFRTLREGTNRHQFAKFGEYLPFGKLLRKTHLDELPQLWNVFKRDMNIVGPRPEERETFLTLHPDTRRILTSRRPGMTSLASLQFSNEEEIIANSKDVYSDYWTKIKPMKIHLDVFYIQNRDIFLDLWIIYRTFLMVVKRIFKR